MHPRRTILPALLGALLLAASAPAGATALPGVDSDGVADEAKVLGSARAAVAAAIAHERGRSGVELRVLTLPHSDEDPRGLAVRTLNAWSPGPRSVLLLVVMDPHQIYIQPGTQLAGVFDQASASSLASREVAPLMRQGRYADAIQVGLRAIVERIQAGAPAGTPRPFGREPLEASATGSSNLALFGGGVGLFLLLALVAVVAMARRATRRRCGKCGAPMNRFDDVLWSPTESAPGQGEYRYTCTGCGDSFAESYAIAMLSGSSNTWSSNNSNSGPSSDGSGGGGSSW